MVCCPAAGGTSVAAAVGEIVAVLVAPVLGVGVGEDVSGLTHPAMTTVKNIAIANISARNESLVVKLHTLLYIFSCDKHNHKC